MLGGNNREIGRGAECFSDAEACRIAVKEVQARTDELVLGVRRDTAHTWIWQLVLGGRLVATAAHGYDRLIRCERGLEQFRDGLSSAEIGRAVMISEARRWGAATIA